MNYRIVYYTYVLRSQKDRDLYIGYSADLKNRLEQHQRGEVKSTKQSNGLGYRRSMDKKEIYSNGVFNMAEVREIL